MGLVGPRIRIGAEIIKAVLSRRSKTGRRKGGGVYKLSILSLSTDSTLLHMAGQGLDCGRRGLGEGVIFDRRLYTAWDHKKT